MKRLFSILLIATISIQVSHAQLFPRVKFVNVVTLDDWEKFLTLAEEENLAVMVEICVNWAEGCRSAERSQMLGDRALARFINTNYLSVQIDADSEFGEMLTQTFPVTAYPAYLFGSYEEVVFSKLEGLLSSEDFLKMATENLNLIKSYPELVDKYLAQTLNREEWLNLLGISELNNGLLGTQPLAREFMLTLDEEDLNDTTIWPFITRFCLDIENAVFRTIARDSSVVKHSTEKFDLLDYFRNVYNYNLTLAIFDRDSLKMERIILEVLPLKTKDTLSEADFALRTRQVFLTETFNWEGYLKITKAYVEEQSENKAQYYQGFAQQLLENYEDEEAAKTAEVLIDEGLKLERTFELVIIKAYILSARGEFDEAQRRGFEAKRLAANNHQDRFATEFLNSLPDWNRR